MLDARPTAAGDRAIQVPSDRTTRKEEHFIREVIEPELVLRLDTARSKIVRTNYPIIRISIGDTEIADTTTYDAMEVEFIGVSEGETTATLWFKDEDGSTHLLRYIVQVVESSPQSKTRIEDLQQRINELFPNSLVILTPLRNKLIVRGQARDSAEADKIMSILGARSGGNLGSGSGGGLGNGFGGGNGAINGGAGGTGGVGGGNQSAQSPTAGFQVVNLLRVPGVQQVMLKVRVAELSRYSSRDLGADLRGIFNSVSVGTLADGLGDFTAILDGEDVRFFIRAVTANGYGRMLAEPTLVTLSGKPARFLAGGEFAVPTTVGVDGVEAATTTFRGFGTELAFTPTVIDKDMIRLQVNPSFSSINTDTTVNGIPGLDRRMVDTTVDLREGQWLAIAGLIQDEQGGNRTKLPYISRLPVIGGLFGKRDVSRQETELIVLVSPQLVHPLEAEQVPLILPGMEVTDPTDDDFFRRRLIEGYSGFDHRSTVHAEQDAQRLAFDRASKKMRRCSRGCQGECGCDSAPIELQNQYLLGPSGFSE